MGLQVFLFRKRKKALRREERKKFGSKLGEA